MGSIHFTYLSRGFFSLFFQGPNQMGSTHFTYLSRGFRMFSGAKSNGFNPFHLSLSWFQFFPSGTKSNGFTLSLVVSVLFSRGPNQMGLRISLVVSGCFPGPNQMGSIHFAFFSRGFRFFSGTTSNGFNPFYLSLSKFHDFFSRTTSNGFNPFHLSLSWFLFSVFSGTKSNGFNSFHLSLSWFQDVFGHQIKWVQSISPISLPLSLLWFQYFFGGQIKWVQSSHILRTPWFNRFNHHVTFPIALSQGDCKFHRAFADSPVPRPRNAWRFTPRSRNVWIAWCRGRCWSPSSGAPRPEVVGSCSAPWGSFLSIGRGRPTQPKNARRSSCVDISYFLRNPDANAGSSNTSICTDTMSHSFPSSQLPKTNRPDLWFFSCVPYLGMAPKGNLCFLGALGK